MTIRTALTGGLAALAGLALTSVAVAQTGSGGHHGTGHHGTGHHGSHQTRSGGCDHGTENCPHHGSNPRPEAAPQPQQPN